MWISAWCLELNQSSLFQLLISADIVHYFSNANPSALAVGRSLRKTTTSVVGAWEQSLSPLPINPSICVYKTATKNRDQHWALLSQGGMEELMKSQVLFWSSHQPAVVSGKSQRLSFSVRMVWTTQFSYPQNPGCRTMDGSSYLRDSVCVGEFWKTFISHKWNIHQKFQ